MPARRSRSEPRVTVIRKARYRYLLLRYRDPITGAETLRSSGTNERREAERAAARWEAELATAPANAAPGDLRLVEFLDLYRRQHLRSLADASHDGAHAIILQFGRETGVLRIRDITPQMLTDWAAHRREQGNSESTIQSKLTTLRAALSWAVSQGILSSLPRFPRVQRAKTGSRARVMKGRPITRAEFVRMLRAVGGVVGIDARPAWRWYLRGLWLSGLRLEESIGLSWEPGDTISVDMTGRRPMFLVPSDAEKGGRDRFLPITPDFAAMLERVPLERRVGPVFPIPRQKAPGRLPSRHWVSHVVSAIGRAANVVVDPRRGKTASAHDLRRSFGARWALLVMPQVLMELMRHESIETTMRYYVGRQAEQTADAAWQAYEERHARRD